MKVLIADADWHFTRQAESYLESHAHNVATETKASEVLAHARHWQPDLVILSAELAEDGEKSLLDSLGKLPNRPAVLLTEFIHRYDRAWRMWQQGGDDLLIKPILSENDIHAAVTTAMTNAAAGRPTTRKAATA